MLILVIFCQDMDTIAPEKIFLRCSYRKPERSRNVFRKMFSFVPGDILCDPDKLFEVFDINVERCLLGLALVDQ